MSKSAILFFIVNTNLIYDEPCLQVGVFHTK